MTSTEAAQLALATVGSGYIITSLDDGSTQASICSQFLPQAIEDVLAAYPWSRARTRAMLPKMAGHDDAFALPPDAVQIEGNGHDIMRVDGAPAIIANTTGPLEITYTARIHITEMTPLMGAAVAMRLAYYIGASIAGKDNMKAQYDAIYREALGRAIGAENQEKGFRTRKRIYPSPGVAREPDIV